MSAPQPELRIYLHPSAFVQRFTVESDSNSSNIFSSCPSERYFLEFPGIVLDMRSARAYELLILFGNDITLLGFIKLLKHPSVRRSLTTSFGIFFSSILKSSISVTK